MQWQRQEKDECWITSLAMVTGKTVRELHAEFTIIAGLPFHEAREFNPVKWFETVNIMHKRHNLIGHPGCQLATDYIDTPPGSAKRVNLTKSLLCGTGILVIDFCNGYAHAVAFENGMILDPNIEGAMILKFWKLHHRLNARRFKWRIDRARVSV